MTPPAATATAFADPTLAVRVSMALESSPHFSVKDLELEAAQGRVTLRGVVPSYYHKQMAQEAIRRIEGVSAIDNHLQVHWTM